MHHIAAERKVASPGNGPKGSLFLLGATALENLGVEVDPIHKKLKPILAVIGGFLAVVLGRVALVLLNHSQN